MCTFYLFTFFFTKSCANCVWKYIYIYIKSKVHWQIFTWKVHTTWRIYVQYKNVSWGTFNVYIIHFSHNCCFIKNSFRANINCFKLLNEARARAEIELIKLNQRALKICLLQSLQCVIIKVHFKPQYYSPNLSFRLIHWDMCGNCNIFLHFLLFPLLLSPPPVIKKQKTKILTNDLFFLNK